MSPFEVLVPILAVVLSLGIPIVAIISGVVLSIRKKNRETELRKAIIENNVTDPESIKLLIEEQEKKENNKYVMLRWGCILLGGGIGAIVSNYAGADGKHMAFWIPVIAGMGLGMLIAFVIEYHLSKKDKETQEETKEE